MPHEKGWRARDLGPLTMRFGSLFSGIGGLDLGLERAGMSCAWQVEIEPYCLKVLEKHWPEVKRYGNVKEIDWSQVEPVDLICGGFPCQPFSVAGKRKGVADERNLWPEMLRAVTGVRPCWVLGENVPGLGSYLDTICSDLEGEGYEVLPLEIPAAAFGAPHLRYRLFIVANRAEQRGTLADGDSGGPLNQIQTGRHATWGGGEDVAHTYGEHGDWRGERRSPNSASGQAWVEPQGGGEDVADSNSAEWRQNNESGGHSGKGDDTKWQEAGRPMERREDVAYTDSTGLEAGPPDVSPGRETARTLPGDASKRRDWQSWWATEPDVGRVAHGVPHRVDRLRALGNAVVPQVAQWIGERIVNAQAP